MRAALALVGKRAAFAGYSPRSVVPFVPAWWPPATAHTEKCSPRFCFFSSKETTWSMSVSRGNLMMFALRLEKCSRSLRNSLHLTQWESQPGRGVHRMNDRQRQDERTGAAPTAAIQALVLAAREKFARDFPGEAHCFDASIWD